MAAAAYLMTLWMVAMLSGGCTANAPPPERIIPSTADENGWHLSFAPGARDTRGRLAGGTEIINLVAHNGRLYAGNGYWMDTVGYRNVPWAQVLVLDEPNGQWQVDLELKRVHMRTTVLKSLTFRTDGQGQPLDPPVTRLIAGSDHNANGRLKGERKTHLWIRNDTTDRWVKTILESSRYGRRSIRALTVHRDQVTGVDRIFAAAGALGIYSGVYDRRVRGEIRWDPEPELGPVTVRPMSLAEVNGQLYASVGAKIYRREDGRAPRWTVVYRDNTPEHWHLGGIRALTPIPHPDGEGKAILFSHHYRIIRLDPANGYRATVELNLTDFLTQNWGRAANDIIVAAYEDMLPITDPVSGETVHMIGIVARVEGGPSRSGWYPGAGYAIRYPDQRYRYFEVNGRWAPGKPQLVATRAYVHSPFPREAKQYVYVGGFDAAFLDAHNTAWIYRASIATVLGYE